MLWSVVLWSGRCLVLTLVISASLSAKAKILGLSQCVEVIASYSPTLVQLTKKNIDADYRLRNKWINFAVINSQEVDANAAIGWRGEPLDTYYKFEATGNDIMTRASTPICAASPDPNVPFPSGRVSPYFQISASSQISRSPLSYPSSSSSQSCFPPSPQVIFSPASVASSTSGEGEAGIEGHIWVKNRGQAQQSGSGDPDEPMFRGIKTGHSGAQQGRSALFCDGYWLESTREQFAVCCEFDKDKEIPDLSKLQKMDKSRQSDVDAIAATFVDFLEHIEDEDQYRGGLYKVGDEMIFEFDGIIVKAKVIGAGTSTIVFQFYSVEGKKYCDLIKLDRLKRSLPGLAFRRITFPDESSAVFFYYHQIAHAKYLSERKVDALNAQFWRSKKNSVYIMQPLLDKKNLLETYFKDVLIGKGEDTDVNILGEEVTVKEFLDNVTMQILDGVKILDNSNKAYNTMSAKLGREKMLTGYLDAKYPNYQVDYDWKEGRCKVAYMDPYPIHLQMFNRLPSRSNAHLQYEKFDKYFHSEGAEDLLAHEGLVNKYQKKFEAYSDQKKMLLKLAASIIDPLFENCEGGTRVDVVKKILLEEKSGDRYNLFRMTMDSIAKAANQLGITATVTHKEAVEYSEKRIEINMLLRLALTFVRDADWEEGDELDACQLFLSESAYERELIAWARELYGWSSGEKVESEREYEHRGSLRFLKSKEYKKNPQILHWLRGIVKVFLENPDYRDCAGNIAPIVDPTPEKMKRPATTSISVKSSPPPPPPPPVVTPDTPRHTRHKLASFSIPKASSSLPAVKPNRKNRTSRSSRKRPAVTQVAPPAKKPCLKIKGVTPVSQRVKELWSNWRLVNKGTDIKTAGKWPKLVTSNQSGLSGENCVDAGESRLTRMQRESHHFQVIHNELGWLPSGVVLSPGLWPLRKSDKTDEAVVSDPDRGKLCDFTPFLLPEDEEVLFWKSKTETGPAITVSGLDGLLGKLQEQLDLSRHYEQSPSMVKELYPRNTITFGSMTGGLAKDPSVQGPVISSPSAMVSYLLDLTSSKKQEIELTEQKQAIELTDQEIVVLIQIIAVIYDVDIYIEAVGTDEPAYRLRPYEFSQKGLWAARYEPMPAMVAFSDRQRSKREYIVLTRDVDGEGKVGWQFMESSFEADERTDKKAGEADEADSETEHISLKSEAIETKPEQPALRFPDEENLPYNRQTDFVRSQSEPMLHRCGPKDRSVSPVCGPQSMSMPATPMDAVVPLVPFMPYIHTGPSPKGH